MPRLRAALRPATLLAAIPLAACAVAPPSGPTVVAMPHAGESLNQFQADDLACRDYAQRRTAPPGATQAAANRAAVGATNAGAIAGGAQTRYDVAYAQCMTSKGNVVAPAASPMPPAGYGYAYPGGAYAYDGFVGIGPFFWGPHWHGGWHGDGMGTVGTAGTGPHSMAASAMAVAVMEVAAMGAASAPPDHSRCSRTACCDAFLFAET